MSATSATREGQRVAEEMMGDTCRITKAGEGEPAFDPANGTYTDPERIEVYGPATAPHFGICRIPRRAGVLTSGAASSSGEVGWMVGEWPLDLPVTGSEGVSPGMTVDYLSAELDDALVGRRFTIVDPPRQSRATARHFKMKEGLGT